MSVEHRSVPAGRPERAEDTEGAARDDHAAGHEQVAQHELPDLPEPQESQKQIEGGGDSPSDDGRAPSVGHRGADRVLDALWEELAAAEDLPELAPAFQRAHAQLQQVLDAPVQTLPAR